MATEYLSAATAEKMSPIGWAIRPLKRYADFNGRAPRAEYWWFVLGLIIVFVTAMIIESFVGFKGMIFGIYGPLTLLLWLATITPSISVGVRRLHDTDRSGYWILIWIAPECLSLVVRITTGEINQYATNGLGMLVSLVAAVGSLVLFVFCVLPGTEGPNRYGPDPYGPDQLEEVFA